MGDGIALIVNPDGSFEVRASNYGSQRQVAWAQTLDDCLRMAASNLGHAIVIPISGPDSSL